MPAHLSYAQGLAFVATILAAGPGNDSDWHYAFRVEHVIVAASSVPAFSDGAFVEINQPICEPIPLRPGDRYVITTDPRGGAFSTPYSLAWRLSGNRATFVSRHRTRGYEFGPGPTFSLVRFDASITAVRTLDDAVFLVMHGSMPETDTSFDPPTLPPTNSYLFFGATAAIACLAVLAFRRRLAPRQR